VGNELLEDLAMQNELYLYTMRDKEEIRKQWCEEESEECLENAQNGFARAEAVERVC
jgi:hypothetical protein